MDHKPPSDAGLAQELSHPNKGFKPQNFRLKKKSQNKLI
jgi:hypothetical protein